MRVLQLTNISILACGIMSILEKEGNLEVIAAPPIDNGRLNGVPASFQPDVVLLEVTRRSPIRSQLSRVLASYPQVPIIAIDSYNDRVRLYHGREVEIDGPAGLIAEMRRIRARKEVL